MINKPAKYLDKILDILSKDFDSGFTEQEIQNKLKPTHIEGIGIKVDTIYSSDQLIDLRKALSYLQSKNLIENRNVYNNKCKITFEGYIKIKTNSFSKEICDKKFNQTLQRIAWTVPVIISVIALVISLNKGSNISSENTTNDTKTVKSSK